MCGCKVSTRLDGEETGAAGCAHGEGFEKERSHFGRHCNYVGSSVLGTCSPDWKYQDEVGQYVQHSVADDHQSRDVSLLASATFPFRMSVAFFFL
jgi:hypothetical protein